MKKLISLRKASFFLMTLSLIMSCSKKEGTTPPPIINPPTGGGGTPTPTVKPSYLDLKADDTTVVYGGSAKITISTDGDTVTRDLTGEPVNGSITINNIKGDSTISLTSKSGDRTMTKTIRLHSFSPNTSKMMGYTPLHMTFYKSCPAGAENLVPIVWTDSGFIDLSFRIQFLAQNRTQSTNGPGYWYWTDFNENAINFGANDVWRIILYADGFDRWQIKNGYYTLQKFRQ